MTQMSLTQVRAQFNMLSHRVDDLVDAGILRSGTLQLQEGSPTYGRAWRLWETRGDSTGLYEPLDGTCSSYLGWTRTEAYLSLRAMEQALYAVQASRPREAALWETTAMKINR